MKKILLIIGTRPDAIKMAPLYLELKKQKSICVKLVSTGQHHELLYEALSSFDIQPHIDFKLLKKGQNLVGMISNILNKMGALLEHEKPDIVLGHGDTATCYATALCCFYSKTPFVHIEAGLRSYHLGSPFPEEYHRQHIAKIAQHHFAPSVKAFKNLESEGVYKKNITLSGNTVKDALHFVLSSDSKIPIKSDQGVLTLHRRELPLKEAMQALNKVAQKLPHINFIFPMHANPMVQKIAQSEFKHRKNVNLIHSLSYRDFVFLVKSSKFIITDSGGIQEEAVALNKQVFILRDQTEREDGLSEGMAHLIGVQPKEIYQKLLVKIENLISIDNDKNNIFNELSPSKIITEKLFTLGFV